MQGIVYADLPETYFGWIRASWSLSFEEIEAVAGLDAALLIEFVNLSLRILVFIGVPMVSILCPLHYFYGDESRVTDKLSKLGLAHLGEGRESAWLWWIHSAFVWWVVVIVLREIFQAQEKFVGRRYNWLLRMPKPRSTTVMVEGIPEDSRTDQALKERFGKLFGTEKIEHAYVVRHTRELQRICGRFQSIDQYLAEAHFEWQQLGGTQENRPICRDSTICGKVVDKIDYYTEQRREVGGAMLRERKKMLEADDLEAYSNIGFVTFSEPRDAAIALNLKIKADEYVFKMSVPPCPTDIYYNDLSYGDHQCRIVQKAVGYSLIIALFLLYIPIVLAVSSFINLNSVRRTFPEIEFLLLHLPIMFEKALEGFLATAALVLFMSFLPSALMRIHKLFFALRAGQWAQHRVMIWYFWFLVLFVLLVSAVGSSVSDTIMIVINHPTIVFELFSRRLPGHTHFYMNFMTIQWVTHAINLTRYMNLVKFKFFGTICEEKRAKELSEPEDQDYYGMGSRHARFTLNTVIALVYCSLCPLITVVTCVNFVICKVIYSYLLYFAEIKKPDLGGHFWVNTLKHTQVGLMIYVVLMMGIMAERAPGYAPAAFLTPALCYAVACYFRFQSKFEWEFMPFEDFIDGAEQLEEGRRSWKKVWSKSSLGSPDVYMQKELLEPEYEEE
jgi:hypothetical protein